MTNLKEIGYYRLSQVLEIIPISKSLFWEKVKSGEFPQPVKLSARTTAWLKVDIHNLINKLANGEV